MSRHRSWPATISRIGTSLLPSRWERAPAACARCVPVEIVRLGGILDIGDLPFDLAAMIEPFSCCLSAAEQCSVKHGDTVLVAACGPLGLMHTVVCRAAGARVIAADIDERRLAKAAEIGAEVALNPTRDDMAAEVRRLTGVGADVVIAALGTASALEQYLPLVRNGGIFNVFGGTAKGESIRLDPRWLNYGEIVLTGTFAASLRHFRQALDFVRSHPDDVSSLISERCRLDDVLGAVERIRTDAGLKTIILFD